MVIASKHFLPVRPIPQMLLGQRLIHLLGHGTESRQLLPAMAEMIGQSLSVKICILLVSNVEQSSFQGVVWTASKTTLLQKNSSFLEDSWFKELQIHEYPLLLNSNTTSRKIISLTKDIVLRSALGLRIVFQGKVNGMVIVGSSQQQDFSSQEAPLLEIADSLAIANHFFQNLQSVTPLPTEPSKGSGLNRNLKTDENAIFKAWYEATRQKLEQQRLSHDQLIHNIVTVMSDQIRNPLAIIRMGIEMLRSQPPSPEILKQRLDIIEQEWRKLNEINDKILQLKKSKFNPTTLQLHPINFTHFIQQLIKDYELKCSEFSKQLTIKTHLPDKILFFNSDISYLQRICDELFSNAKKFAVPNTELTLKISEILEKNQPSLVLKFSNITQTVNPKNLRNFFEPFYREQWGIDSAISGIGLGLSLTKELVEQLDGRITVSCESIENSDYCLMTFTVTFPLDVMAMSRSHVD